MKSWALASSARRSPGEGRLYVLPENLTPRFAGVTLFLLTEVPTRILDALSKGAAFLLDGDRCVEIVLPRMIFAFKCLLRAEPFMSLDLNELSMTGFRPDLSPIPSLCLFSAYFF